MKSNQSRIAKAREFLALQPADRPLLVLSPSRMVSEEVTRGLAEATFGHYRLSWDQFLEKLTLPLCLGPQRPLTRLGRWALLQQTLRSTELKHLQAIKSFPGFAICLERTLGESRVHGVELPHDLGRLGSAYEENLTAQGLLDRAEMLRLAAQAIAQDSWVGGLQAVLVLDLELESQAETSLLEQLLQRVPNHCRINIPRELSLDTLQSTDLKVVSAPDEALECQEVARELRWGAEQGWCWDEMAVLLRQPERYSWCLQSALERAEIPAYFSEGSKAPILWDAPS